MTGPGDEEPDVGSEAPDVGSVADEAMKLLGALSGWAAEQGVDSTDGLAGLARQAVDAAHGVGEHLEANLATGAPECTYCPICRTVHLVRRTSPEVRAHLSTAAVSLLQAAAGMLAGAAADQPSPAATNRVQHIDLDPEDEDPWTEET